MNPKFFGDSYDIVKRFFCAELRKLGYSVAVNPMLTDDWRGSETAFFNFIGINLTDDKIRKCAIFFDPDTGVSERGSPKHVSIDELAQSTRDYKLVFSFDQSFSRQFPVKDAMQKKLSLLANLGVSGMYYDSHARFLFVSSSKEALHELRIHLESIGLPKSRIIEANA